MEAITNSWRKMGIFPPEPEESNDEKVNDLGNWTDKTGITHIHVVDRSAEYQLVNGEWFELPPF